MKREPNNMVWTFRRGLPLAVALAVFCATAPGPIPAHAQGTTKQKIGSVSARAPRSSVTLGGAQTSIELSGGVSIQTDAGDILRAQRITLLVAPMPDPNRPGQTKTDVRRATAVGDVSFKRVDTVKPANGAAYRRIITGSAARGELDRATDRLTLTQGVQVRSEDPTAAYSLQNVAAATLNLATNSVAADAPGGEQMKMTARQRVVPEKGQPYWRLVNGSARHGEMDRKANTAVLTGNVDIAADEPSATYTWKNAARATIDFTTQKIDADALNGQQMQVDVHFKQRPATATTKK